MTTNLALDTGLLGAERSTPISSSSTVERSYLTDLLRPYTPTMDTIHSLHACIPCLPLVGEIRDTDKYL